MKTDPDFTLVSLKLNAAGSWCNAGRFPVGAYEEVKAHCLALAHAAEGSLKFKLLDAAGGTLEHLRYHNGKTKWHEA